MTYDLLVVPVQSLSLLQSPAWLVADVTPLQQGSPSYQFQVAEGGEGSNLPFPALELLCVFLPIGRVMSTENGAIFNGA